MKKQLIAASMATLMAASLAACGSSAPEATTKAAAESTAAGTEAAPAADSKEYKVGIVLFMDHPSLNQIKDNVASELDRLSDSMGVTFNYADYTFNGQGDASVLNQISSELISDEVDVIIPIATPAAQVVQAAVEDKGIPYG